jgi:hypothetical protein
VTSRHEHDRSYYDVCKISRRSQRQSAAATRGSYWATTTDMCVTGCVRVTWCDTVRAQIALKAGTAEKLVDAMYNPAQPNAVEYTQSFLITYRAWTDPITVLEQVRLTCCDACDG